MISVNDTDLGLSDAIRHQMHDDYIHLHRYPELSMMETETANFVERRCASLGYRTFRCGGTGVVAVLENGDGPVVAFRADMDGLPIRENTGLSYASTVENRASDGSLTPVMHGCGHDTHIASGLAAAAGLAADLSTWQGTIVFVFQPGEETAAGAVAMLADGLWSRAPRPEVIFGQHIWPSNASRVRLSSGTAMAMADSWLVRVRGKQAHASQPQESVDPIVLAAHMIVRCQTVVSREVDPRDSVVVTVGTFHAGMKENIIPETAEFTMNVRSFDEDVRARVLAALKRILNAEAMASGAQPPEIEELYVFPQCYNDPDATRSLVDAFSDVMGEGCVDLVPPVTGSEDFGSLGEALGVPSVFWMFGAYTTERMQAGEDLASIHSPHFAPDMEQALAAGSRAAIIALRSRLRKPHQQDPRES